MTPQEKWQRLNNPKTVEDYGLYMSREELMQIPEGREIVKAVDEIREERKLIDETAKIAGEAARNTVDKIFKEVMGL